MAKLLVGEVFHKRLRPRENSFRYKVYYLYFELGKFISTKFLSQNKFNLFSFRESLSQEKIQQILTEFGFASSTGKITLLTIPRIFGYAFNPVSFYFCHDEQNQLRAVISEVRNTFGESHIYISYHDNFRVIIPNDILENKKNFHVSPFLHIEGHYKFRFALNEKAVGVWIDYYDTEGLMLETYITGKFSELTDSNIIKHFFKYPLVTIKVIYLIHFQALKLLFKRIKYVPKPQPPEQKVSR